MRKVCLAVLVGLPGAGKTTFCKQLLHTDLPFSVVHVCYDNFVNIDFEMHQSFKLQRRNVLNKVRKLITCFGTGLPPDEMEFQDSSRFVERSDKLLVLIDDNNFYRSMRYEYYKLSKELNAIFCQVYFALPLHLAIERNSQRPEKVLIDVVIRMSGCLEPPSERHKWESKVFIINHGECNNSQFQKFLMECFEFTIEAKGKPRNAAVAVDQSELHKVDLLLRKRVGTLVKEFFNKGIICSDARAAATDLNMKRKQILDDIRQGLVTLEPTGNWDYLTSLI